MSELCVDLHVAILPSFFLEREKYTKSKHTRETYFVENRLLLSVRVEKAFTLLKACPTEVLA